MAAESSCGIGIFAKAPRPGEVKTRLIPLLGPQGACALHARLLEHTLRTAREAAVGPLVLCCSPSAADPNLQKVAALEGASLLDQGDGSLGSRMRRALQAILLREARCMLIGADCPSLSIADLRAAARALQQHDVVLTPAEDGGYVLIGCRRAAKADFAHLFDGIAWSTPTVMQATRERLREMQLSWLELPLRWDVDRPEDYQRLRREMPSLAIAGAH